MYRLRHSNRLNREERSRRSKVPKMERGQKPAGVRNRATKKRDSSSFKACRKLKEQVSMST